MVPWPAAESTLRLLHTVRHLRSEQVLYRLYYHLGGRVVRLRSAIPVGTIEQRRWAQKWSAPLVAERTHLEPGRFRLLDEEGVVNTEDGWNRRSKAKLWLYNLHYLDDLNALGADDRPQLQSWLIEHWREGNPPLHGVGWDPYPLSLRLVNLIKWFARQESCAVGWLESIAGQAQALAAQEERDILGNHLFANGKALVFAGSFLCGGRADRWLRRGLRILDEELSEQFLGDGGHFERSPMYHSGLLWDLCDLLNLAQTSELSELQQRRTHWRETLRRGQLWLEAMSHPDGEISFFNDAAFGVAPSPRAVAEYAARVGIGTKAAVERKGLSLEHLEETGYVAVHMGPGCKALLDVAPVGPSYQPGHAHADTLSFELSVHGERVFVNSGTSVYGDGPDRQWQRSTAAHNTVEVDGKSSSEVWAGFRVARRARPVRLTIRPEADSIHIGCAHDGYRWLQGSPQHERQWVFNAGTMTISDRIHGAFHTATARFYLHPAIGVDENRVLRLLDGRILRWSVTGGQASVVNAAWYPRFGVSMANHCIQVHFSEPEVKFTLAWSDDA